jgi:hypothetical protein
MDTDKLTIRRPDAPQPHWAVAHMIYDDGPIVGVLWWEDEPPFGSAVDAEGVVDDEPLDPDESEPTGWCHWIVGDESASPEDPRSGAANVVVEGPDGSPLDALNSLGVALENAEAPTWSYEESLARVEQALWRCIPEEES